jgi:hypothetical protein
MKDQINKLTEAQAKELLDIAISNLEAAIYTESRETLMTCAESLGIIKTKIEILSEENK